MAPVARLTEDRVEIVRAPWYANFASSGRLTRLSNDYYKPATTGSPVPKSVILQRADRLIPYLGSETRRVGIAFVDGRWQVRYHPYAGDLPIWIRQHAHFDAYTGELIDVYAPTIGLVPPRKPGIWTSRGQALESLLGQHQSAYLRIQGIDRGYLPSPPTQTVAKPMRPIVRIRAQAQRGDALQELEALVDGESGALLSLARGRRGQSKLPAPTARPGTRGTFVARGQAWEGVLLHQAPSHAGLREFGWFVVGDEAFQVPAPPQAPAGSRVIAKPQFDLNLAIRGDGPLGYGPWPRSD